MIRNYIKTALRGFWRHKFFTLVNVLGLSVGISSALVIFIIVHSELSFNDFARNEKNLYRVVTSTNFVGNEMLYGGVPTPLAEAIKSSFEQIEKSAPFFTLNTLDVFIPRTKKNTRSFKNQDNVVLADNRYFDLFPYKWLAGSQQLALTKPNEVVLSSEQANKYFPGVSYANMINMFVRYDSILVTVKGIVQTLNQNTDFTFRDFLSYRTAYVNKALQEELNLHDWSSINSASQLFVKLKSNISAKNIEKRLNLLLVKSFTPKPGNESQLSFHLQPFKDLHFDERWGSFNNSNTMNKSTLNGLIYIAGFLLLIGCINFINLSTAQSTTRAKEIGVRKTLGSMRFQLIYQSFTETFLVTLCGVIISLLFAPILLVLFKDFLPAGISTNFFDAAGVYIFLFFLIFLISVLAGLYPAVNLSQLNSTQILKNHIDPATNKSRATLLRKVLTVVQFGIAIFFLIATAVVTKQIYYALHKDLGFRKDAVLILRTPWKNKTLTKNQVLYTKLNLIRGIEVVSKGDEPPLSSNFSTASMNYVKGKKKINIAVQQKYGDQNYINVYNIPLLAGRNLRSSDTSNALIINNSFSQELGFTNPHDAVGQFLSNGRLQNIRVVGVVADFSQRSVRSSIAPLAIIASNWVYANGTMHILLKPNLPENTWTNTIKEIQKAFNQVYPDQDFDYHFFDQRVAEIYETEKRTATLLSCATGLTIFISCLGLLGLAIYTSNRRRKEIGVRKVLGASVSQLVAMLSTELVQLVVVSFVLVTPLAFWVMSKWMQGFAYKTSLNWWVFGACGLGMLLVSLFALSFQTIRAATANPVESLRSE